MDLCGRLVFTVCLWGLSAGLIGCGGRTGDSDQPLFVFGRTGGSLGRFIYPRAVVYSPATDQRGGEYYIADKSGRIQVFAPSGEALRSWIMPKWEAGKPVGLGVAPDGRVFVPDTHYARVLVFDPNGQRLAEFGSFGDGPGQFRLPTDVVFDDEGYIYVSEYGGNDRINKFTPDFQYLFSFADPNSGESNTQRPQGMLWDPEGFLWVTDAGNHRICRFDRDGRLLGEFGELGTQAGQLRFPYGIDRFSDGTLIVAEYGNNRVQRFTPQGKSLGVWGGPGRELGKLASPWAVAVGPKDQVAVIDAGNNRVQVIGEEGLGFVDSGGRLGS